ncbi:HEAT repeat domain-containing protein [Dactylosporangium sp. NBC_01737]|uniref:HEAT repeat domain-containing protein n=1 Tax=Dactylosporangium sp. NBC_01737 TaxID=2975959 RepID=UPI002E155286|nr:HEAT repeat domain-containing protein [Dactylosporangium sp. NBC_01737]
MTDTEVDPLTVFAQELSELKAKSGATIEYITSFSGKNGNRLPRSTIHQKLKGQTPPDWPFVEAFVLACIARADRVSRLLTVEERDLGAWRIRHDVMKVALQGRRSARRRTGAARQDDTGLFDALLADHRRRLIMRYRHLRLDLLTPNEQEEDRPLLLRSVFVPQSVRAETPSVDLPRDIARRLAEPGDDDAASTADVRQAKLTTRFTRASPEPVLRVLSDPGNRLTAILGNPGSGKSTLAQYLALAMADESDGDSVVGLAGWLPLLVELREYAEPPWRERTFLDFIDHQHGINLPGLPKASLEAYLRDDGRAVVVFDGLDELFDPAFRENVTRQIAGFAAAYGMVRVVVTSRVIGYRKSLLAQAGFAHFTIDDLDEDQIEQFTRAWYRLACPDDAAEAERRRKRVVEAVAASPSLRELAGNPLLLTILVIIGRRQELPRDRRRVYEHAAKVLVERWDVERYLRDSRIDTSFIEWEDKIELLQRIARRMQETRSAGTGNHISGDDLVAEFDAYLRERFGHTPAESRPVARAMIKQLHERNFILSHFGSDVYGFVHRAFLEYFSAAEIVHRLRDAPEHWPAAQFVTDVFGAHWADSAWHEVLLLVAGMVPERLAAAAIDHLLSAHPLWFVNDEGPAHILLAIRCLGEVRKIHALEPQCVAVTDAVISIWEVLRERWWRLSDFGTKGTVADSVSRAMLPVVAGAGGRWPGRHRYSSWLRCAMARRERFSRPPLLGYTSEPILLAAVLGAGEPGVRDHLTSLTLDDDEGTRSAAAAALPTAWRDATAVSALHRLASGDPDAFVRVLAIDALAANHAADPATLSLLQARADAEGDEDTIAAVIRAVLTVAREDPATRQLLSTMARSADPYVRKAALESLYDGWADDPDVVALLHDSAINDVHPDVRAFTTGAVAAGGAWLRERLGDPHPAVRAAAVEALATARDPAFRQHLRGVVDDPDPLVRQAAVGAAASMGNEDADALAWLVDLTRKDDPIVRAAAIEALADGWATDPATQVVLDHASKDREPDVRRVAIHKLIERSHRADGAAALLMLFGTDPDAEVRRSAVIALATVRDDKPGVQAWLRERAAADLDPEVRQAATAGALNGRARDADLGSWLRARLLAEPDPATQLAVVQALIAGWSHDAATTSWLQELAEIDLRAEVRATVLSAVTVRWPPDDRWLPFVRARATDDPDENVRTAAIHTLAVGWPRGPGVEPLLRERSVRDGAGQVRAAALRALAIGGPDETDALALLCERIRIDPDPDVREHLVNALTVGGAPDPRVGPLLREVMGSDADSDVRQAAMRAVVAAFAGDADLPDQLRRLAAADPHPAVRTSAVQALGIGWHDHPETMPFLLERADDERDVRVRTAIANHLAQPCNQAPLPLLQDIAVTAPDPDVRREVLQHIAAAWRHDPDVGAWLVARAVQDLHHEVRLAAVEVLQVGWSDVPEAAAAVRDRAERDPHPEVRRRAAFAPQ